VKALITGSKGTVGARLCEHLLRQGHEVATWDRSVVPVDDYWRMEAFVRATAPDVLFHLAIASQPTGREGEGWLINYEWASELAWITRILGIRFVFTSTAMVFSDDAKGPFTVRSQPDAHQGYGYEKRRAEERVFAQNPEARVVRLGWQIGDDFHGNQMSASLERQMQEKGHVEASTRWYPACAFLDDTVVGLQRIAESEPGLYMIDTNERWTFHEIASALSARHGDRWRVVPTDSFVFDQRMRDERLRMPSLKERLATLP
jgi:dTDP-4-dehydrorhamnose reductase